MEGTDMDGWDNLLSRGTKSAAVTKWERESLFLQFDPILKTATPPPPQQQAASVFKVPLRPAVANTQLNKNINKSNISILLPHQTPAQLSSSSMSTLSGASKEKEVVLQDEIRPSIPPQEVLVAIKDEIRPSSPSPPQEPIPPTSTPQEPSRAVEELLVSVEDEIRPSSPPEEMLVVMEEEIRPSSPPSAPPQQSAASDVQLLFLYEQRISEQSLLLGGLRESLSFAQQARLSSVVERDTALQDLRNVENAFNDVHRSVRRSLTTV
jgi:hypothetical protein